jgi:hypothetical protein
MEEKEMKFELTPATAFLLGLLTCLIGLAVNYALLINIPFQTLSTFPGMKITVGGVEYNHLLYSIIVLGASSIMALSKNKTVKLLGFFFLGVAAALILDDLILTKQTGMV